MPGRKGKHIGFKKLSEKIAKQYEKKGMSKKRAEKIGDDTAGKIAQAKKRKR